jgi:hypothetical protein
MPLCVGSVAPGKGFAMSLDNFAGLAPRFATRQFKRTLHAIR